MSVGNLKKRIMNKGLTILANHNTNERIVVFINPTENNIQKIVNEKFGGNWVKVGELCLGDMLKFTSDDIYLGFDNREDDNYCQGALIKK
jgi:hypothetical protein